MKRFACVLIVLSLASLNAGFAPASPIFLFEGTDAGGVGSGAMEFSGIGTQTLVVTLDNTSPTLLLDESDLNTPGITGFGFNGDLSSSDIVEWSLKAYASDKTTLLEIGGSSPTSIGDWVLATTMAEVTLDFLPQTEGHNIKGALYNPLATEGFGAPPNYFTQAVLTIKFASVFTSSSLDSFIRMQNVGLNGEGSLKLTPIPEPATLLLLGIGAATAGVCLRRRQKQ